MFAGLAPAGIIIVNAVTLVDQYEEAEEDGTLLINLS